MIELIDVTKSYQTKRGAHILFQDVNFSVPPNKNIALLGRNGAGKSTLMRILGGAESPSEGEVVRDCSVSWPMGLAGGFQGSLSGIENVRFICRIYGLSKGESDEVVAFVESFAEIGEYLEMPVKTYSSGMRARVMFGLSLALAFDVYLVDELTSVGDFHFREKANAAFEELRKRASIIFASHNLKAVENLCDTAIVLYGGCFEYFENVAEAIASYRHWVNIKAEPPLERRNPSPNFEVGINLGHSQPSSIKHEKK